MKSAALLSALVPLLFLLAAPPAAAQKGGGSCSPYVQQQIASLSQELQLVQAQIASVENALHQALLSGTPAQVNQLRLLLLILRAYEGELRNELASWQSLCSVLAPPDPPAGPLPTACRCA